MDRFCFTPAILFVPITSSAWCLLGSESRYGVSKARFWKYMVPHWGREQVQGGSADSALLVFISAKKRQKFCEKGAILNAVPKARLKPAADMPANAKHAVCGDIFLIALTLYIAWNCAALINRK